MNDIKYKQLVMIDFLRSYINDNTWKIKAEFSTNDNDIKVITVQEQTGDKIVFYGNCEPMYNYYMIDIYGESIQEEKEMSLAIQALIGTDNIVEKTINKKKTVWQVIIKQFSNFQPIEYQDIRRVGYNATMQCIVNKIKEEE
jgi:hypothetical protein